MSPISKHVRIALLLSMLAAAAQAAEAPPVFARIGDVVLTQDDFGAAMNAAARAKFYHGKPAERDLALLQREVGAQMVDRVLLLAEARRRGIKPDQAQVQEVVQSYQKRYAGNAQWDKNSAVMLPPLVSRLEQESLLAQLEKSVRGSVPADDAAARAYYAAHPAKFTEPEQLRVAVIVLKVDPSAPTATWIEVDAQAQALAVRARAPGADFGALARANSADASSVNGGDLGYVHVGMLPEGTQSALAALKPGQVTDSLRLLQGLGVFRLDDRKPARLVSFASARVRAGELAQREQGERAWSTLLAALRAATPAQLDQSRWLPLEQGGAPGGAPE